METQNRNLKSKLAVLIALVFSISACSQAEGEAVKVPDPAKIVTPYTVKKQDFAPIFSLTGTLQALSETTLASETTGTVWQITKEEGEEVRENEELLRFDPGDNNAQLDLETARVNLANADQSLKLARSKAENDEESAMLGVKKAQTALASAVKSRRNTSSNALTTIEAQRAAVESARIGVEDAELNLANREESLAEDEQNLLKDLRPVIVNSLIGLEDAVDAGDQIFGISDENKSANDQYESLLAARDKTLINQGRVDYLAAIRALESLNQLNLNPANLEEAEEVLNQAIAEAEVVKQFINTTDRALANTITAAGFTQAQLDSLKSSISRVKLDVEGFINNFEDYLQNIDTFQINKPQSIRSLELVVANAKQQLAQAESQLNQIVTNQDTQTDNSDTQVEIEKNNVESAKINLEIVKRSNDIAIQNAQAEYDRQARNVQAGLLQVSKLTVTSPVSGTITQINPEVGDTVSQGSALFVIAEIDKLKLVGDLRPSEANQIKVDSKVELQIEDEEATRQGSVTRIAKEADVNTRRVEVEIEVNNQNGEIFPNTLVEASIESGQKEKITTIPLSALISKTPPTVFVIENPSKEFSLDYSIEPLYDFEPIEIKVDPTEKKMIKLPPDNLLFEIPKQVELEVDRFDKIVKRRVISTGRQAGDFIEVTEGLEVGEVILKQNVVGLENGDRVKYEGTVISGNKSTDQDGQDNDQEEKAEDTKESSETEQADPNPDTANTAETNPESSSAVQPTRTDDPRVNDNWIYRPSTEATHTTNRNTLMISGPLPVGTAKITVNDQEIGFSQADRIARNWRHGTGVLQSGSQTFVVKMYDEQGRLIAEDQITIIYEPQGDDSFQFG